MKGEAIDPIKRLARAVGEIERMDRVFAKIGAEPIEAVGNLKASALYLYGIQLLTAKRLG